MTVALRNPHGFGKAAVSLGSLHPLAFPVGIKGRVSGYLCAPQLFVCEPAKWSGGARMATDVRMTRTTPIDRIRPKMGDVWVDFSARCEYGRAAAIVAPYVHGVIL